MGRIVFDTATTINGWIADEQNSLSWLFAVPGGEEPVEGLLPAGASVMVEGRTTYEWVLAETGVLAHPERWREFHGDRPCFVFTHRELPVPRWLLFHLLLLGAVTHSILVWSQHFTDALLHAAPTVPEMVSSQAIGTPNRWTSSAR